MRHSVARKQLGDMIRGKEGRNGSKKRSFVVTFTSIETMNGNRL
jgi:hypothetical protein